MIAEIDKVNQRDHPRGLIIGSTDVVALYPSLDIVFTVEKVCDIIRQSPIKFADLWYEELSLYVAVNSTQNELDSLGLTDVCPKRTTNIGRRPTVKSLNPQKEEERRKNWADPEQSPDESQKQELIIRSLYMKMPIFILTMS